MSRIDAINDYAERREQKALEAKTREKNRAEELKETIRGLKSRIDEIITIGNACVAKNIPIEGRGWGAVEDYDTHQFVTNSWSHLVGFVQTKGKNITMLGINGGGACGEYNFRTNGVEIYDESSKERKEASLYHLEKFVDKFDEFEAKFYAYIDKLTGV